jgi:hypothetical protein
LVKLNLPWRNPAAATSHGAKSRCRSLLGAAARPETLSQFEAESGRGPVKNSGMLMTGGAFSAWQKYVSIFSDME